MLVTNGHLILAKATSFTSFLNMVGWHVDWRLTKVVALDPETWPFVCSRNAIV